MGVRAAAAVAGWRRWCAAGASRARVPPHEGREEARERRVPLSAARRRGVPRHHACRASWTPARRSLEAGAQIGRIVVTVAH
ncbi:hypothetical protein [Streptomyces sp. NPDC047123]|uniref:hypothetical protein n=1 Tax=Streptomyces sp. NPDC047123 TaxID=3155622 RepID=UPI0033D287C9